MARLCALRMVRVCGACCGGEVVLRGLEVAREAPTGGRSRQPGLLDPLQILEISRARHRHVVPIA
jgi:hypothetical protein